ncbi:SLC22A4_5 [Acanthosepion pharaonis]|uniref:SLC22A4_5 n=1 Tax=Acanthosepion pharaonis TaxID=158019 RepID=A0A812ALC6_ACAPH|nr:SLC22A4_5 [Sepia pharaonis]
MVFIVPGIKHRCAIPELANDTYEIQSEAHDELIKEYIPEDIVDGKPVYSSCHLYVNKSVLGNQTLSNCTSWVYDKSIFQTTLTSDFNLVCGKEWLAHQIFTVFFAGYLVAMLSCGWLSDRFGRKTIIIGALMLQGIAGILSSQIMNIHVILVLRFLTAVGGAGSFIPSVVFGTEISSMKNRANASMSVQMYISFGYVILSLLVYYVRNWDLILLLVSLPSIPTGLLYLWVVPESPRWLLIVKKEKEAEIILNKIAEVNKRFFTCKSEDIEIPVVENRTVRLWKIFTNPQLRKRTIILLFNWCVSSFTYYGLLLNTEHLSGNIFLNFFFGALVEIPAYILCMVLLNRVGRKKLYIAFMVIGGILGAMTIFPRMYASEDLQWIATTLAILSRLCITGEFGIIYLHTCELYPTCVRNGALGAMSTFARVGGVIAPYLILMRSVADGKLGDSLPLLIMGIICILAGVTYLFLPETNNKHMEDTFDGISKENVLSIREEDEYQLEAKAALNTPTQIAKRYGVRDEKELIAGTTDGKGYTYRHLFRGIRAIGGCGRYQLFMLNLLYIATVFDGLHIGSMVFIVPGVKHRCAIPELANDTYEIQNEAHAELIKEYIPEDLVDGKPVYSSCHLYANKSVLGNQTLSNCTSWVYDKSIIQTTITSDIRSQDHHHRRTHAASRRRSWFFYSISCLWCVSSFAYYGLMLNTEHLSGNIFLNFFFGALVEVPGYLMYLALLNRFGRRNLYIAFIFCGGI